MMTFHVLVMSKSVAPRYAAKDATVSTLSAVNLTDDMRRIQIASLGSDLCHRDRTLAMANANGFV